MQDNMFELMAIVDCLGIGLLLMTIGIAWLVQQREAVPCANLKHERAEAIDWGELDEKKIVAPIVSFHLVTGRCAPRTKPSASVLASPRNGRARRAVRPGGLA